MKGLNGRMFKRRIFLLIIIFAAVLGVLAWNWSETPGISLETEKGSVSAERLTLDLQGSWNSYSSLRQAYTTEINQGNPEDKLNRFSLTAGKELGLPSAEKFHVVAKHFQIQPEWSARSVLLQINGVYGEGAIYLNGIDSAHRIGKFENEGGSEEFLLPANALNYGEDNILLIESSAPPSQANTLLGMRWPAKGQIKGDLQLIGTMETSLAVQKVSAQWNNTDAVVSVQIRLNHHSVTEYGPWDIQGVLSDGSAAAATASTQVKAEESAVQDVTLTFNVPRARAWSPTDPFNYQLYLTLLNPKGDKDDVSIPLGLSTAMFKDETFVQNGQPLTISGLTLSPEQEARIRNTGNVEEWLTAQKSKGYNLLYFIGSFPDEAWLKGADKIGMGIWAELPPKMVPADRVSNPSVWETMIQKGMLHPSLWAWTVGTGLESDPRSLNSTYWENVRLQTQPLPAFAARLTEEPVPASIHKVQLAGTYFNGPWGKVVYNTEGQTELSQSRPQEKVFSGVWAAWVIIVIIANIGAANWRYREIFERKPKRALRNAWNWQGLALLTREGTLAGLVISLIFNTQVPWANWIPEQWPLWTVLKQQPPLLIWIVLASLLVFLRVLQVGVAAPRMPEAPNPLGLALWLERRYRWIWIPALLWAAQPFGLPIYLPLAAYIGLTLLYLPIRMHDVHKIKGQYRPIMAVPNIFFLVILALAAWRWSDGYYLWHFVTALRL